MRICVVGTGYVGLVVGTGLAENGHTVTCVDKDGDRIASLAKGQLPIFEPGLEELVVRNMEEERLRFSTDLKGAVANTLLVFICVGTPQDDQGLTDVSGVFGVAKEIALAIDGYRVIVNKSTCPVGTTEQIRDTIANATKHDFDVVSNPEFLKEGNAVDDFMRPDRIVVGCEDVRVIEIMRELYAPFLRTGKPFLTMSATSAEMCKYAANAMLAARISLMNEFGALCAAYGADVNAVREGVAADSRIGSSYLFPGIGFGGSCLPKDVAAAVEMAKKNDLSAHMLEAINAVNEQTLDAFVQTVLGYYGAEIRGKKIAVWGVSYKPRTDDLRGAPALRVIDALLNAGANVSVYDPAAGDRLKARYGNRIHVAPKNYAAIEGANGLIICTEWNEFRRPDYDRMAQLMADKVVFDGRNIYTPKTMAEAGFKYFSVGRPSV
jgi:UDPglucose 6-dehydrogenase